MGKADELLAKVRDYYLGNKPYDFWRLDHAERANASADAWQELFREIEAYLHEEKQGGPTT